MKKKSKIILYYILVFLYIILYIFVYKSTDYVAGSLMILIIMMVRDKIWKKKKDKK